MSTKRRILDAAFKLIAQHGYENTAISMICKEADIRKSSLYHHFSSKENLFISLISDFLKGERTIRFDLNTSKDEFSNNLIQYGMSLIERYNSNQDFSNFVMEVYVQSKRISSIGDDIRKMHSDFRDVLSQIIACGENYGLFDVYKHTLNCDMLYNTIHGIEFSIIFETEINYKEVWINTVQHLLNNQ